MVRSPVAITHDADIDIIQVRPSGVPDHRSAAVLEDCSFRQYRLHRVCWPYEMTRELSEVCPGTVPACRLISNPCSRPSPSRQVQEPFEASRASRPAIDACRAGGGAIRSPFRAWGGLRRTGRPTTTLRVP